MTDREHSPELADQAVRWRRDSVTLNTIACRAALTLGLEFEAADGSIAWGDPVELIDQLVDAYLRADPKNHTEATARVFDSRRAKVINHRRHHRPLEVGDVVTQGVRFGEIIGVDGDEVCVRWADSRTWCDRFDVARAAQCESCQGSGIYYEDHGQGNVEELGCGDCQAVGWVVA